MISIKINIHFLKANFWRDQYRCSLYFPSILWLHLHFIPSLYLNCVYQSLVTSEVLCNDYFSIRLQMVSLQPVTWLSFPSLCQPLLLAFLDHSMSLWIIFGLLSWLVFIYLLLNCSCPPLSLPFLPSTVSLSNPNHSKVSTMLKTLMPLFSFTLSSYINNKMNSSFFPLPPQTPFLFPVLENGATILIKVRTLGVIFHSSNSGSVLS